MTASIIANGWFPFAVGRFGFLTRCIARASDVHQWRAAQARTIRTSVTRTVASLALLASVLAMMAPASAQAIYKCKNPDGRITYSSVPCQGEGAPVSVIRGSTTQEVRAVGATDRGTATGQVINVSTPDSAAAQETPVVRAPLPRQCDNGALLQPVVMQLASPGTPDDIRAFLAGERFRLVRCEFTRFTVAQRRERDAAMRDLETRDPARRRQAIQRVEALYDLYLTPSERLARTRGNPR
jgi:hypothetical protein